MSVRGFYFDVSLYHEDFYSTAWNFLQSFRPKNFDFDSRLKFSDVKQMNSLNRFISRVTNLYDKTLLLKKESMRSENNLRDLIRDARSTYNRIGKSNNSFF